jgi:PAS domain S-box-containing protein
MMSLKILYVDDDAATVELTRRWLAGSCGCAVVVDAASTVADAMARLEAPGAVAYDLVLVDLFLPDDSGLALLQWIREVGLPVAVVVVTDAGDEETAVTALKAGADDYVAKREDYLARLPLTLSSAVQRHRTDAARRPRRLRVLYAEPSSVDADVTRRHLARRAPHLQLELVKSGPDVIARLTDGAEPPVDVVLLDYRLPDLDALDVVKELRQVRRVDVPIVIVTGQGDEELAVHMLKLGASGYVVKNRGYLDRLPAEIEAAFHSTELARRQAALAESEERFRTMADQALVQIRLIDAQGRVEFVNRRWTAFTGRPVDALVGDDPLALVHPDDRAAFQAHHAAASGAAGESRLEYRLLRRDGTYRWILETLAPRRTAEGVTLGFVASGIDITERREAEEALRESEERYRVFFEESPVGASETELESGRMLRVNDALCAITGYDRAELLHMVIRDLTHPEDWPATRAACRQMVTGETARYGLDKRYIRKDGRVIWVRADATRVHATSGRALYGVGVIRDITERHAAQDEIRRRDLLLQAIFQSLSAHVVVLDHAGRITYTSRSWDEFALANRADITCVTIGVDYLSVCRQAADRGDATAMTALAGIEGVMRGRVPTFTIEYPCHGPTADQWYVMHVNPMPPEHGGVVISHTDITAQKHTKAAFAEQKTKYQEIFEGARVAIWEVDYTGLRALVERLRASGVTELRRHLREHPEITREAVARVKVRDLNRHAVQLHAAPSKRALLSDPARIVGPEMEEAVVDQLVGLADGRPFLEGETTVRTWDGERRHVLYTATFPPRPSDTVLLSAIDITERKRAEQALRASEARYRTLVESQTELICRYLPDTTLTFVNDAYCRFFGRPREELIGTRFLDLVPEASRDQVLKIVAGHSEVPRVSEHEVLRPDGTVGWQEWVDRTFVGADGSVVELQGIGRDISVQKRAEMALRESEEALRRSRDQIQDLAGRLISAQEEERRRISRELHDDLNQKIAALAIAISNLRRRLSESAGHLGEPLTSLQSRAIALANDVRRLSHDLHPAVLEHAGLVTALRAYCDKFGADSGVEVTLAVGEGLESVPDDVALCLYRVTQETLRNTAKHSGSKAARIRLAARGDAIELAVCDEGTGFEVAETRARPVGIGLISIGERVRLLHGSLEVHSAPGQGTEVLVRLPLGRRPR